MANRLINALQAEEPLDLNGFLNDPVYPPIDEPNDLVGQEITGWVVKKYPVCSPIVNMIADKNGNCFLLLRTFTCANHAAVLQGEFELSSRLRFRCPERQTNGARLINEITSYCPFAFDRYARVIRGIGEDEDKIYVDQIGIYIQYPLLDKWSPPGTQFICSLDFHINWTLKGPKCEFFFSNFIQWTPEDLKFIGCKWPIVNDGGIETFRKLSMDSGPNFKTYENRPFNRMCARYLEQMPGRPEDERLFEGRSFARIMLWMNSPSRLTKLGIDSSRKLKYKIGKWYCVSVVSSRLDHRIWEIRSKKSIKMYGPIATEYLDQMDAFYRALEPDAYYVPTYRYANKPTPYVIECIQLTDRRLIAIRMVSRLVLVLNLAFIGHVLAQTDEPKQTVCAQNQLFNGEMCTCAPGYFASTNNESMARCEDECEEVYFSFFTYGTCAKGLFDKRPKSDRAFCDTVCGVRLRLWTSIGIFCVFAAAIATLVFTLPLCIATCTSCIHSRKASKHSKRVYNETQAAPSKDQQLQAVSPYYGHQYAASYWPYYHAGR